MKNFLLLFVCVFTVLSLQGCFSKEVEPEEVPVDEVVEEKPEIITLSLEDYKSYIENKITNEISGNLLGLGYYVQSIPDVSSIEANMNIVDSVRRDLNSLLYVVPSEEDTYTTEKVTLVISSIYDFLDSVDLAVESLMELGETKEVKQNFIKSIDYYNELVREGISKEVSKDAFSIDLSE